VDGVLAILVRADERPDISGAVGVGVDTLLAYVTVNGRPAPAKTQNTGQVVIIRI